MVVRFWERLRGHYHPSVWAAGFLTIIILGLLVSFFLITDRGEVDAVPADTVLLGTGLEAESSTAFSSESQGRAGESSAPILSWKADIKGAVAFPGVYEVDPGMRIQDLIDRAGGLRVEAEVRNLNLAQLLEDQMMVYVPISGEGIESGTGEAGSIPLIHTPAEEAEGSDLIDLNTADITQLQELNGIGEKKAELIIQYRQENGLFQTIEELMNVKGIGEKTFASLKDQIRVSTE